MKKGDVGKALDWRLDITFGLQVVQSSSPVSLLFREAFNHPYISFFHLLRNNYHNHQLLQTGFLYVLYAEAVTKLLMPIDAILPEICAFIVGFSCTVCIKMISLQLIS